MYQRGTLEDFKVWHEKTKQSYGIPPEGMVGYVNGHPAPGNQRTINYTEATQNPDKSNDYIWVCGAYPEKEKATLLKSDVENLNWFARE